ncbi:MAG: ABC transporter substrate-binding protein [Spirochaetales bacterium]|nr:ABC transporter substrate-binding protein [Spirochaetales bacterium]MCF7937339.1 ABC transporter substrate-binding protein [Spirochaetales bacterium]
MKNYAKVFIIVLALMAAAAMPLIAGGQQEAPQEEEAAEESAEAYQVGIAKFVSHPALDAIEQGIMDELDELGVNAEFDLQNANADMTTAASIANKFKADEVDLVVGIATPTAQALVNTFKDTPVIYSAVTDPVDAGLVDSYDEGGANVTGASDMTPVRQQIEFLADLIDLETLGHVYSSSEANAVRLAELAREACEDLGIEFVESTVQNSAEVKQATQSIVGRVDGIYVSNDNTVVSALGSLSNTARQAGVPVMSADPSSAETYDVLAAWGFNYYKMGRATGKIIKDVLEGTPTSEIPTRFMTSQEDIELLLNLDLAEEMGIEFPEKTIENAATLVKDGEVIKQNE